jgi:hypothetical protein
VLDALTMHRRALPFLVAACVTLGAVPSATVNAQAACAAPGSINCPNYERYVNHKYGFAVEVPTLFAKKSADADGRAESFELADRVRVRAWAMVNSPASTSVEQLYGDWGRREGLTFKTIAGNTWVVRGHEGKKLYYSRSILADGIICTIEATYDRELGDVMEPVLARIGASLMTVPEGKRVPAP